MSRYIERAQVLIAQSRYDAAEKEIGKALSETPDDPLAHAFLALILCEKKQYIEAIRLARFAVSAEPDAPFYHYVLSIALQKWGRLDDAMQSIDEAIRLDPEDADYFETKSAILAAQYQWDDALTASEQGLAIEADHIGCANIRALALNQLGRKEEAAGVLTETLRQAPENAHTHLNMGWTKLRANQPDEALRHFNEAIRIDPTLETAKAGIIEALKAKSPVYSILLRWFLWLSRFSSRTRFMIIFGVFAINAVLVRVVNNLDTLAWLRPIISLPYLSFVLMTWFASPLLNTLMMSNRYFRNTLTTKERISSLVIGGGVILISVINAYLLYEHRTNYFTAFLLYCVLFPLSGAFGASGRIFKPIAWIFAGSMVILWFLVIIWVLQILPNYPQMKTLANGYAWGSMLSTWVFSALSGNDDND